MLKRTLTIFGIASLALADKFTGYSEGCHKALQATTNPPEASACLNTKGISEIESSIPNGGAAISKSIDSWLKNGCSAASCSNDTVATMTKNVIDGCWQDFGTKPNDAVVDDITGLVQQYFNMTKEVFCLKNETAYCSLDVLTKVTSVTKAFPIPLHSLQIPRVLESFIRPTLEFACTDCAKAAYTLMTKKYPEDANDVKDEFEERCGAAFVDGTMPSTVTQTANKAVQSADKSSAKGRSGHVSTNIVAWIGSLLLFMHYL